MKVLVVRAVSAIADLAGFTAVIASAPGVASLCTGFVWRFAAAGLAHGSASRFSNESLRIRRVFPGLFDGVLWFGSAWVDSASSVAFAVRN